MVYYCSSIHTFSECGGGTTGVLADETGERRRPEEWRPGGVRVSAIHRAPFCLLRQSAWRQLLRQLPGKCLVGLVV